MLQMRPTPPHLTSAAAEGILAQACENESQNAKRMRMGLEPLAVSHNVLIYSAIMHPAQYGHMIGEIREYWPNIHMNTHSV